MTIEDTVTDVHDVNVNPEIKKRQAEYDRLMREQGHGAKCRKIGFKGHRHQQPGTKLGRNLERQGSVYGRVSLVQEMFNDMNAAKFAQRKEIAKSIV